MCWKVCTLHTPAIADSLQKLTISTFGGNPISCAAGSATIGVIEKRDLRKNSEVQGKRLRDGLERLKQKYPRTIGDVRGMGLMQGVEHVEDETRKNRTPNAKATVRLFEETKKRGLLIGKGGLYGNVLRISPPLTVTAAEVDEAIGKLDESYAAMGA